MKKKLLVTMVMIAILISGCNSNQAEDDITTQIETTRPISKDFDPATNLKAEFKKCTYEIPNTWSEHEAPNNIKYYLPKNGRLVVQFYELESPISIYDKDVQDGLITGWTEGMNDANIIAAETISINEQDGFRCTINGTMENIKMLLDIVYFNVENGMISFTMGTYANSDEEYTEDFNKILDSIVIPIDDNWENDIDVDEDDDIIEDETEPKTKVSKIYEEDMYKVGKDIPAGEYILFCDSDYDAYFEINEDSSGDSIIANDNFSTNSIIKIKNGEYLNLSGCYAVKAKKDVEIDTSGEGMFRVGIDIEPGEYKLVSDGDYDGYYEVTEDARHDDIVNNDNFTKSAYVTVKNGQYLLLNRCCIK